MPNGVRFEGRYAHVGTFPIGIEPGQFVEVSLWAAGPRDVRIGGADVGVLSCRVASRRVDRASRRKRSSLA
jgi:hypothetical protein